MKKRASYLDEIGACREAIGYDGEQVGLDHEQEVASFNNWEDDDRDIVGRAASIKNRKKRLAKKLLRISRELEALEKMEDDYKADVEEMLDGDEGLELLDDESLEMLDDDDDDEEENDKDDAMSVEMGSDEWFDENAKEASHPIEHDQSDDNPEANAPSTMGDDEWISIGPAKFDDQRNEIGKAAAAKKIDVEEITKRLDGLVKKYNYMSYLEIEENSFQIYGPWNPIKILKTFNNEALNPLGLSVKLRSLEISEELNISDERYYWTLDIPFSSIYKSVKKIDTKPIKNRRNFLDEIKRLGLSISEDTESINEVINDDEIDVDINDMGW